MSVNSFNPDPIWEKIFHKEGGVVDVIRDEEIHEVMAYALLISRRNEWAKAFYNHNGHYPDSTDVDAFNSAMTDHQVEAARDYAQGMMFDFSQKVVDIRRPEIEKEFIGDLRDQVAKLRRTWPGFLLGVVTGIIGNILYSLLTSSSDGFLSALKSVLDSLHFNR